MCAASCGSRRGSRGRTEGEPVPGALRPLAERPGQGDRAPAFAFARGNATSRTSKSNQPLPRQKGCPAGSVSTRNCRDRGSGKVAADHAGEFSDGRGVAGSHVDRRPVGIRSDRRKQRRLGDVVDLHLVANLVAASVTAASRSLRPGGCGSCGAPECGRSARVVPRAGGVISSRGTPGADHIVRPWRGRGVVRLGRAARACLPRGWRRSGRRACRGR